MWTVEERNRIDGEGGGWMGWPRENITALPLPGATIHCKDRERNGLPCIIFASRREERIRR